MVVTTVIRFREPEGWAWFRKERTLLSATACPANTEHKQPPLTAGFADSDYLPCFRLPWHDGDGF